MVTKGVGSRSEIWPDFFIVGAAKCGTSSLYAYLKQHPQVYMSPNKEPHFFSQIEPGADRRYVIPRTVASEDEYLNLFREANGAIAIGEASPSYLWDEAAAYRMRDKIPEARIIIVLRDPIERAFSHYLMNVREGTQNLPFYEALLEDQNRPVKGWTSSNLYVELGQYASQVERYINFFGRERVCVILSDELKRDTEAALRRAANFLHVDEEPVSDIKSEKTYNSYSPPPSGAIKTFIVRSSWIRSLARTVVPQKVRWEIRDKVLSKPMDKPEMDQRSVEMLRQVYEPDVSRLEELLGRGLLELRRSWDEG